MKATINFNNEELQFDTIKELKTFLNGAYYYANDLILFNGKAIVSELYSNTNNIATLISECNFYGEVLNIIQDFN
jgi:hypothetical protein